VQSLELLLIVAGAFIGVAYVMVQYLSGTGRAHSGARLLLGVVPGLFGVALVMVDRADLVPDDLEGSIWIIVVVTFTAFAVIGTTYRLARR
jgi:drug/metabolite transporter (DMT)-like permease